MADGSPPSPEAVFVGAAIARSIAALVARSTLDDVDPGTVVAVGLVTGAVVVAAVAAIRRRRGSRNGRTDRAAAASGRPPIAVVVGFGLAVGATAVCSALALDRLPAREASALFFVGPLLLAAARVRSAAHAAAIALAAIGVVLVAGLHSVDARATVLLLGASLAWAVSIATGRCVAASPAPMAALAVALVIAAAIAIPFGAGGFGEIADRPRLLLLAGAVGILVAAVAPPLELHVLRRVPADRFGVLVVLVPVVGAFFAYVALDETPTALDLVGAVVVVAAVVLDGVRRSPAQPR